MQGQKRGWPALLVILLLAFGLRFQQLGAQSFWNDEGNSARLSERSISLIIEGTASDIHPPLYYLLLRGWRELVGETEFGLRSFSAFVGVGTVAVTLALAKKLNAKRQRGKSEKLSSSSFRSRSILVGVITAVSPPLIYYSQETRMYALLALLAVLSTWLLRLATAECGMRNAKYRYLVAYASTITAGLYTHYFFPAVILGHAIYVILQTRKPANMQTRKPANMQTRKHANMQTRKPANSQTRKPANPQTRKLASWVFAILVAGLLYLPWLPIFLNQVGGRGEGGLSLLPFLRAAGSWLVIGETLPLAEATWPLLAALVLAGIGVVNGRSRILLPLIMLTTPLAFMAASGATQPQYFKFLGVAVPFGALLIAEGWRPETGDWKKSSQSLVSTLFLFLLFWGNGRSLHNLYTNPTYARADYRSMVARIVAENHPNAAVVLNAPNQWEVFTYYFPDADRVYPIPRGAPNAAVIAAELAQIAADYDRIYAIFWGDAQRDPERLVERWLDEHAFKATDEWYRDVRFVTYAVPAAAATEMAVETAVTFGPHITLQGYTLGSAALQPGDIIQVTLFWETAVALDQRYKVFLHLVGTDGLPLAQRDSEPGGGLNLTTIWQPGQTVIDNHGILVSPGTPPGTYTLLLGLYDVADPTARLLLPDGRNALPLAEIKISDWK